MTEKTRAPGAPSGAERESLGAFLRTQRDRANLTLRALSERTGCSHSALHHIEQNTRSVPGDGVLVKIASALGLDEKGLLQRAAWQRSFNAGGDHVRSEVAAMQAKNDAAQQIASLLRPGLEASKGGTNLDAAYKSGSLAKLIAKIDPQGAASAKEDAHGKERFSARADADADTDGVRASITRVDLPVEVPIINRVAAGYPREFTDMGYPARVADEYVRCPDLSDADAFAARVVGDSMMPAYAEGDVVVFSPAKALVSGQDCFARLEPDHDTTFKRVFFEKDADGAALIRLQPLNAAYPPRILPRESVAGLYAAVAVIKRLG